MQWRRRIKAGIPKIRLNLKAGIWKGTVGDMHPEKRAHNRDHGPSAKKRSMTDTIRSAGVRFP